MSRNHYNRNIKTKKPVISYSLSKDITKDKSPKVKKNTAGDIIYNMQYIGDEKFEYWLDYDEQRRPIKYKDTRGRIWNCIYNSKGNISYYWDNSGYQEIYKYYANELVICTNSFGDKVRKKVRRNKYITRNVFIAADYY